ncbi:Probable NAD-dependent malic enzyme 4 [Chlamydiales bacterium SCGC AB-751-O23]|jgi:malate dehydrogenase (oxaloacetate-decarboxylating)|nr:Probable NAD-dependent malic enzyme 4 [Chlamydiales bacterium SCGC AB-751-O23]
MKDWFKLSLEYHKKYKGKLAICNKAPLENSDDLSLSYTPGVAAACEAIKDDVKQADLLTVKGNAIAIVTDGSAVLGLGDIGPEAAMPVMEGKAVLFKKFADIDAWPICLRCQDVDSIVATIKNIAPGFGGINLEDIAAPKCFEVEERLQDLGIPVFHDDQHGTAIVVMAALINACRVTGKRFDELNVVISGAGAAGNAIAKILSKSGEAAAWAVREIIVCDSKGAIYKGREGLNDSKAHLATFTNPLKIQGSLKEVLRGKDVFIGVSRPGLLDSQDIKSMSDKPFVFALANPDPEIMPEEAMKGGAEIYASGRSDFSNQVNNALVFPGIFRGALDAKSLRISSKMKLAAALALANSLENPQLNKILPALFNFNVPKEIAKAVQEAASS